MWRIPPTASLLVVLLPFIKFYKMMSSGPFLFVFQEKNISETFLRTKKQYNDCIFDAMKAFSNLGKF